ncbi:peptidoglycan-recognition protein LC-like [Sitodiplosis mosellana]|uniref:peptidoglycan-recognition protein LC-like n=1 Tax=Sitodiplosis mosellana TaxID=263140 RepID=UPI002443A204|nr:peptidoglycan-recognition protein LC-like [Sitodiplosis mosellana]
MSGIVLSAVELMSSTVSDFSDKVDGNIVITETPIQIDDVSCEDDDDNRNHTTSIPTIFENQNNLDYSTTNRQRSPTTNSIGSNNISIVTLDENDNDSSVVDSDSDVDEVINCNNDNEYRSPNGIVLVNQNIDNQSSILCTNNDVKPNIGSIAVQNSSDITFGNKTFYQGPVTIKQFVYDKNKWKEAEQSENDNLGYVNSSTDNLSRKEKDFPVTKDHPDEIEKKWKCTNKQALASAIAAGVLACSLLLVIIFVKFNSGDNNNTSIGDGDDSRLNEPIDSKIGSDIITDTAGPLRIVSRSDWIAQPPSNELVKLEIPATRVIIAHTATENCTTQASCTFRVRLIQTFHIESRGWDDIGYNFLVGGDGSVYVGRGWDIQGAHTKGYNIHSICIAFIGTFNKIAPPKRQLYAAQKLIEEGVKLKKLIPDYRLYGHRQLIPSESPGLALYEIIKTWDHFSEEINLNKIDARKLKQLRVQREREMTAPQMINRKASEDRIMLNSTGQNLNQLQPKWIWAMVIVASTLSGALFGSLLTSAIYMRSHWHANNDLSDHLSESDVTFDTTGQLKFVSRNDWVAQPPEENPILLELPSTRVIIAHTATQNCSTQASCKFIVRSIQAYHVETLRMDDISYNFLIDGNGNVYIGRGFNIQGRHTNGFNEKSICIAFIGNFLENPPPDLQLKAAQKLIEEGVSLKKLDENYNLYGHRQLKATESPGQALYEIMKTWNHWTPDIK